jgi:hypothetical protein
MRARARDRRSLSLDGGSRSAVHRLSRSALAWSGAVSFRHVEAPAYRSGYRPRVTLDESTQTTIVLGLAVVVAVLLVWVALLQRSEARLRRRLRRVLTGGETTSLDEILDVQAQRLDGLSGRMDALNKLHHELEASTQRSIQKVGVIRYNPFADAGGDQSFAIALLDAEGTGVVVSSLHSRTETRVFAKPVRAGRSTYALSDEEQQAVKKALEPSA